MTSDIWKFSPISNRYIQAVITRVAIFRQENYFAVYGTRRNRWQFRRNSIWFAEEKNLGIPFWTISQNRKTLGIPFRTIFRWEKPSEFRSESFSEEKKIRKKTTFVSSFVKLHYFSEFCSMSTLFRRITKTVPSLFRRIFSKQNFDGNPNYYWTVFFYEYLFHRESKDDLHHHFLRPWLFHRIIF